jgi:hypothetical protein
MRVYLYYINIYSYSVKKNKQANLILKKTIVLDFKLY